MSWCEASLPATATATAAKGEPHAAWWADVSCLEYKGPKPVCHLPLRYSPAQCLDPKLPIAQVSGLHECWKLAQVRPKSANVGQRQPNITKNGDQPPFGQWPPDPTCFLWPMTGKQKHRGPRFGTRSPVRPEIFSSRCSQTRILLSGVETHSVFLAVMAFRSCVGANYKSPDRCCGCVLFVP